MAQYSLYIDTNTGEPVRGPFNSTAAELPKFYQGDTISFRVYLLERTTSYPLGTPYEVINNADLALKMAIGPKNGTAGSTLYTSQFTWGKDAANQYFFADLPLNTSGINTLIGANESATAWFEVEYTQNALPTTVLQKLVTVNAEVIETASLTVPPGETALSAETASATYLQRVNTGFYLQNATTGAQVYVYLADDGQVHFDPVSA